MNVTESNAVCVLLSFIGHEPSRNLKGEPPEDRDVITAFRFLAERAGQGLQVTQFPEQVPASVERFLGRLRAADSDGAAQAVCRAIERQSSGLLFLPKWLREPHDEWKAARARQEAASS